MYYVTFVTYKLDNTMPCACCGLVRKHADTYRHGHAAPLEPIYAVCDGCFGIVAHFHKLCGRIGDLVDAAGGSYAS